MKRTALYGALAALPLLAFANDNTPSTATSTVIVTAKALDSAAPTPVPAQQLRAQQAATSDTASLLKDVPGVSLYGAGGASSLPAIHGLADDRVRVKLDGMDLIAACPNHMNPALSYLDPSNVATLKVYAGIAPVSVGGDSIGGTIIAETLAPEFATAGTGTVMHGEIGGFYRSNGGALGGNLSATLASETLHLSYSGATAKSDNYQAGGDFKTRRDTGRTSHTLALNEVGSTAYNTRNHTLGIAIKNGRHLLDAKLGYQDLPEQLYPNQRMDMLANTQHRLNLRYVGEFDWGSLEARTYRETVKHFMDFGADKQWVYGNASGMPMHTESQTTGASLTASIDLTATDLLRVGAEWQRHRLDDWWPASGTGSMSPGTFWNINNGERDRHALFAEWQAQHTAQWLTLLGVRHERVRTDAGDARGYNPTTDGSGMMNYQMRDGNAFNAQSHDKTDHNWDLTALARYTANAHYDIEFGLARKVRSPNLYERYTWSTWSMAAVMNNTVGDGNGYIGNLQLKPEVAHTLSASVDWHAADRAWEFKATPHYTLVSDYIDAIKTASFSANQFNVLQYANQSARLYGVDLSGHLPLAKTGAGEFALRGLLNYTRGKNRDSGDDLYNIMPLNAKLTLTHTLGGWENRAELVMVHAKDTVSAVRNEIETGGYSLLNLRTSYGWQKARVDIGIENVFDKRYDLPLGGAYVGQGKTMSLNDASMPWGIAVPGAGRSLYAGFNLKF